MLKKFVLATSLSLAALSVAPACGKGKVNAFTVPPAALEPGGAFVAYVAGCEKGCDQIKRGDLIQDIDGNAIQTSADVDAQALTNGEPHKLKVRHASGEVAEIEIVAKPNEMPPIDNVPPFWTVGAAELNKAPDFARRRLFGHASPQIYLISSDGGSIDGRSLYGKKNLIVYFDWATNTNQADAGVFLQVLQQGQAALKDKGVNVVFAQIPFPGRGRAPMTDTDLRKFQSDNGNKDLPGLPLFRMPNSKEANPAAVVGMEGAFTVAEALGESPAIVIQDERGIIRWHSEGLAKSDNPKLNDQLYTIDAAIRFSLEQL